MTKDVFHNFRSLLGNMARPWEQEHSPAASAPPATERRRRRRVNPRPGTVALIIDDSPTVALSMKVMLESAGMQTLVAPDAETGLDLARAKRPELIFLDILMPGMNGFSALRHMRRDDQIRDTPVIMLSRNDISAGQFAGSRIDADDFITKPPRRHDLFPRIEHLLDGDRVPRRRQHEPQAAAPA